jgi:hypothetical protein
MIYDSIELTSEELQDAIAEGKKKKWFKLSHETYWIQQERKALEAEAEAKRILEEKRYDQRTPKR